MKGYDPVRGEFEPYGWECEITVEKHYRTNSDVGDLRLHFDTYKDITGNILKFEVNSALKEYHEKLPEDLLEFFSRPFTELRERMISNDAVANKVEEVLTGTVEGQEFLELVISENTNWVTSLNISNITRVDQSDVVYISDIWFNEEFEDENPERWKVDDDFDMRRYVSNNGESVSEFFGMPIEGRYVIRLVDEQLNHWLFVGKSSNVPKRLKEHEGEDGDFSKAREVNMEFLRVEEVRDDVSKSDLYKEVYGKYDIPKDRIC